MRLYREAEFGHSALPRVGSDGRVIPRIVFPPVQVIVGDDGLPGTILTDEVALTSILRNLLSNRIKYTDRGEVRLSARMSIFGPREDDVAMIALRRIPQVPLAG